VRPTVASMVIVAIVMGFQRPCMDFPFIYP
jgi:hypothetical protein